MNDQVFPSKIDWWLGALIILLFIGGIAGMAGGIYWLLQNQADAGWSALASGVFTTALIVVLVWPVRYTLTQDALLVQSGLLRSKYTYTSIRGASPSRNLLSSPALSLDRLKINLDGSAIGFVLISPVDKLEFMQALATRAPHLKLENNCLHLNQ